MKLKLNEAVRQMSKCQNKSEVSNSPGRLCQYTSGKTLQIFFGISEIWSDIVNELREGLKFSIYPRMIRDSWMKSQRSYKFGNKPNLLPNLYGYPHCEHLVHLYKKDGAIKMTYRFFRGQSMILSMIIADCHNYI